MFNLFSLDSGICAPSGFFADGLSAGLKAPQNNGGAKPLDVAFVHSHTPCDVFALFTTNTFDAAPIKHAKELIAAHNGALKSNFVLVNAKNANAMTGKEGVADVKNLLRSLQELHPQIQNPLMSSTGVIGVRLPMDKIASVFGAIDLNARNPHNAANAILTTDRFAKEIAFEVKTDSGTFTIGAMCKGAGMIHPSLATMLCFVTTDACVPREMGQELLRLACEESFNAVSVDGDMSTNDTVLLLANGQSGAFEREAFLHALKTALHKLATDMARDGEGATKLVAFEVHGAKNREEAKRAARALATSLLVKTAIFGCDPNWGRIASTIGASGVCCDEMTLTISFGDVCVYRCGAILFDAPTEARAAEVMRADSLRIVCDLGQGEGAFVAYGCDLGYNYVKINADYRS